MADNVVFRIELVDGAGTTGSAASGMAGGNQNQSAASAQTVVQGNTQLNTKLATGQGSSTADYDDILKSHIQRLRERQEKVKLTEQLDADAQKLAPELFPDLKPLAIDEQVKQYLEKVRSRIDQAKEVSEIEKKAQEMAPELFPDLQPLSIEDEAKHYLEAVQAQIEKNQKAESILAEAKRLQPELFRVPEFDPMAEARKRLESEERSRQVKSAYNQLTGKREEEPRGQSHGSVVSSATQLISKLGMGNVSVVIEEIKSVVAALGNVGKKLGSVIEAARAGGSVFSTGSRLAVAGAEGGIGSSLASGAATTAGAAGAARVAGMAAGGAEAAGTAATVGTAEAVGGAAVAAEVGLAASGVGAPLAALGLAVGATVVAVGALAYAFNSVAQTFIERGRELQGYSQSLTTANAQAEVRSLMADIREAQELGDSLARLTDAQSRLSEEIREWLLPIKKFIIEFLADFLEKIADGLTGMRAVIAGISVSIADIGQAIALLASFSPRQAMEILANMPQHVGQAVREALRRNRHDTEPFGDKQIEELMRNLQPPMNLVVPDELRQAANMGLNIPAFGLHP